MGRKPNPDRKPELLRAVVAELARSGLGDMSLRPLAAALDVSTYTLTYQFGSKEELLAEALTFVEAEQAELVHGWMADGSTDPASLVTRYWSWVRQPDNLARVRLIFESVTTPRIAALLEPAFRRRLMSAWVEDFTAGLSAVGLPGDHAGAEATLAASALAGMVLDLLATGDHHRLQGAADALAQRLTVLTP